MSPLLVDRVSENDGCGEKVQTAGAVALLRNPLTMAGRDGGPPVSAVWQCHNEGIRPPSNSSNPGRVVILGKLRLAPVNDARSSLG